MNAQDRNPHHGGAAARRTRRSRSWLTLLPLVIALGACKPEPAKVAVAACRDEIPKHTTTPWEMEDARLAAGMKPEAGGVTEFVGLIVFEKGLPSESTQTIVCRTVITTKDDKTSVDVISVQFFPVDNK
jgi:hypothetical protein